MQEISNLKGFLNFLLVPLVLANYISVFGSHPFEPTMVKKATAKVIAVHNDAERYIQVVVEAPSSGQLILMRLWRTSIWYSYQFTLQDVATNDIIDVCHYYNNDEFDEMVDVDCFCVRWSAFFMNFLQGAGLLSIVLTTAMFLVRVTSFALITFRMASSTDSTEEFKTPFIRV